MAPEIASKSKKQKKRSRDALGPLSVNLLVRFSVLGCSGDALGTILVAQWAKNLTKTGMIFEVKKGIEKMNPKTAPRRHADLWHSDFWANLATGGVWGGNKDSRLGPVVDYLTRPGPKRPGEFLDVFVSIATAGTMRPLASRLL